VALRLRRLALVALLLAVLSACTPALTPLPAPAPVSSRAAYLVNGINAARAGRGLPPVALDPALHLSARRWAGVLAAEGGLRHSDLGQLPLSFTMAGENVAVAGGVASAHLALVQSPGHYANMVNGAYTKVGVSAQRSGDGRMFVVEQFCRC
jgi:uncharacterized protein YkwD